MTLGSGVGSKGGQILGVRRMVGIRWEKAENLHPEKLLGSFRKKLAGKKKYGDLLFSENLTAWTFKEVSVLWAVTWPTHLAVEIHSLLHAVKSKLNRDYKRNNPMSVCCTTI